MDERQLFDFLTDTLALWRVDGTVEPAESPAVAIVHAANGITARIERAPHDVPYRWSVRWDGRKPRTCGSLVGVLAALRTALGVERGAAVRIAH